MIFDSRECSRDEVETCPTSSPHLGVGRRLPTPCSTWTAASARGVSEGCGPQAGATWEDNMEIHEAVASDAEACGRIMHSAFRGIAEAHGFPPDIPSDEMGSGLAAALIASPTV